MILRRPPQVRGRLLEVFVAAPKVVPAPIVIDERAGRYAYCQCGWSETLPYCDGSHSRMQTGCIPMVCDVPTDGRRSICQCHASGTLPWCDGSHKKLEKTPDAKD